MKLFAFPKVSLVWGAVGVVLFLTLGLMEVSSGGLTFRVVGYLLLLILAIFICVRSLMTILGRTRPRPDIRRPEPGADPENRLD